jgi:dipeptide/tripeptide permease
MLMWKHTGALYSIAFGKFCDTFSFFGTQTILIFYLMEVFHFSKASSFIVFGIYSALLYISPLVCGYVADNYLGTKHMLMLGVILNALGNFLIFLAPSAFWVGLVIMLLGSGAYRTTSAKLIGHDDKINPNGNKEPGYTFYYFISNLGGFLSPILYGLILYTKHWGYCYLLSSVLLGVAIIGLIPVIGINKLWFKAQSYKTTILGYLSMLVAGLIMLGVFELKQINNDLMFSIGFFSVAIILAVLSLRYAIANQKVKLLLLFNVPFGDIKSLAFRRREVILTSC